MLLRAFPVLLAAAMLVPAGIVDTGRAPCRTRVVVSTSCGCGCVHQAADGGAADTTGNCCCPDTPEQPPAPAPEMPQPDFALSAPVAALAPTTDVSIAEVTESLFRALACPRAPPPPRPPIFVLNCSYRC